MRCVTVYKQCAELPKISQIYFILLDGISESVLILYRVKQLGMIKIHNTRMPLICVYKNLKRGFGRNFHACFTLMF